MFLIVALLVVFGIPGVIKFSLGFGFPNFIPGCSMFLYSSQAICPWFHTLFAAFLCLGLSSSSLFIHTGLLAFEGIWKWRWSININWLSWTLFSPGSYAMGLFWTDSWRGQSQLSWRQVLWACFSPSSMRSGSWNPPWLLQTTLPWSSHPKWAPPCWGMRSNRVHFLIGSAVI